MAKKRYKKSFRAKKKKSIFRSKFFWQIILFFIIFSFLVYLFFFSSLFQIKEIDIRGMENDKERVFSIASEELNNSVFIVFKKNIFTLNTKKTGEHILRQMPELLRVRLVRRLPGSLIIELTRRQPEIVVCSYYCYYTDNKGIAFEMENEDKGLPYLIIDEYLIKKGERVTDENIIKTISEIDSFFTANDLLTENFKIEGKKLEVLTKEGWQAYFNIEEDVSIQISNLELVLRETLIKTERDNLRYIDLRFQNKVYYKYY